MTTRDGHLFYNDTTELVEGLKCNGAVSPLSTCSSKQPAEYDVVVVGAGYAGLTACRDLCTGGHKVLLIEGRDRIGGRTFTTEVDGYLYEMGGTWVHWNQPHTYREMSRYRLTKLLPSHDRTTGLNYSTIALRGKVLNVDHEKAHAMTENAFRTLCDVDGKLCREIIPYPHDPHFNPAAMRWEKISVAERIEQIKTKVTEDEIAILQARLSSICGTSMDKAGLFDVLRWWALGGYTMDGLYETGDDFKIPTGQSSFARCFFNEALDTGNLTYSFSTPVQRIQDEGTSVVVNQTWRAKRVICTIPLNVLRDVRFEPPLSLEKAKALHCMNINHGAKVHLEVSGSDHRSWSSAIYPVERVCSMSGDGLTSNGNTHIVCFGSNKECSTLKEDAQSFVASCQAVHDMGVLKTIWHNWSTDPFSKGAWCMYSPDTSFEHLSALQERAGNVLFASSDWADGWRGFIDGAIEQGMLAAKDVTFELRSAKEQRA